VRYLKKADKGRVRSQDISESLITPRLTKKAQVTFLGGEGCHGMEGGRRKDTGKTLRGGGGQFVAESVKISISGAPKRDNHWKIPFIAVARKNKGSGP